MVVIQCSAHDRYIDRYYMEDLTIYNLYKYVFRLI